ncbi:DNA replication factor C complex subunit Rfc2 (nucleomorph) [Chroomonas mesostigmatica CCMP1168]|uniref:DNA replication factor C complex subunit Rfc2 n=1 Tax=Chroomonas mesostigmatica CCMP1168 TaxID=1195612 RepID=J7G7Q6_9CRYP|nr:DNA replication factor C complex subunit Rfc2 [Chroomonas mesostigmatica CCMP1168]|mmetsp:Transcript_51265/g.124925  ORF Transcript_51265/g.124925 Transcript_51265/m.124925 type:complete len:319 (-) Transcript_51265:1205-2161(-)
MMKKNYQHWIKKYNPLSLNQLSMNKSIKKKFISLTQQMIVPNLVLAGPPGSGKTSGIVCFLKNIFIYDYKKNVLRLNASDQRGVEIVRQKIKLFCKRKSIFTTHDKKLVLLDEADSMTEIAQEALRRLMELFSNHARFIFICNFPSSIIEPIQSRCIIFRLKKIKKKFIAKRLVFILKQEKIFFDVQGLDIILYLSNGDIRQTLNMSEIIVKNFGELTIKTTKKFYSISDFTNFFELFYSFLNKNYVFSRELLFDIFNECSDKIEILQYIFSFAKKIINQNRLKLRIISLLCKIKLNYLQSVNKSFVASILALKLCQI